MDTTTYSMDCPLSPLPGSTFEKHYNIDTKSSLQGFFRYACQDLLLSMDIPDLGSEPQHHLGKLGRKRDHGLLADPGCNLGV